MNAHTPGPWVVKRINGRYASYQLQPAATRARNRMMGNTEMTGTVEEMAANRLLIAAAPELLTQCQRALDAWTGDGPALRLDDLRATIAKATGDAL